MCEKCVELKQAFHDAETIIDRELHYKEFDKQRKKCAKALGSLAPVPAPAAVVTKERKPRKKKEKPEAVAEPAPAADPEPETVPAPAKTKSKKAEKAALPEKHGESPGCKFYYRGGLCANSSIEKPFCPGIDKCPLKETKQ